MPVILTIALCALTFSVVERLPAVRRLPIPWKRRGFMTDLALLALGFGVGSFVSVQLINGALAGSVGPTFLAGHAWASVLVALILLDGGNFTAHWLLHRFESLWELHKVHHSSPSLDWLSTFRSHVLEQVVRRVVAPLGLIALGLPEAHVLVAAVLFTAWSVFIHANVRVRLDWLEPVFVTPRLHHRHHGAESSGHNFGTVFTWWDRLAGTFMPAGLPAESELGVPGEASYPQDFRVLMMEPLRRLFRRRVHVGAS